MTTVQETQEVVRLDGVRKVYGKGEGAVVALNGVTLGFASDKDRPAPAASRRDLDGRLKRFGPWDL